MVSIERLINAPMQPHWIPTSTIRSLWLLWIFAAGGIVWLANATHIDLWLADQQFDFSQHRFPLKHAFFYETVMHTYAKHLLTIVWLGLAWLAWLPAGAWGDRLSDATRYKLRWIMILALFNAVVISWLKHQMPHACPWDIARYGGDASWVATFSAHPAMQAGHCFPAGHTTSGVWLAALSLLFLPHAPRKAMLVGIAGLAVGFTLGWAQQIRGAHFLSHTLTSLWLMWGWLLLVVTFSKSRIS